jgi:hypothetical protein
MGPVISHLKSKKSKSFAGRLLMTGQKSDARLSLECKQTR